VYAQYHQSASTERRKPEPLDAEDRHAIVAIGAGLAPPNGQILRPLAASAADVQTIVCFGIIAANGVIHNVRLALVSAGPPTPSVFVHAAS
jgi:hypothetical protein